MRLKKKTKTQIANQANYCTRAERRFQRVIIKNKNQEKIKWIRENLFAITKLFDLKEKSHKEEFIDFFREGLKIIRSDKKLLLYRYLTKALKQMGLEESYFFTLLIYLYTNFVCFWDNNLGVIDSQKMRDLKIMKKQSGIGQKLKLKEMITEFQFNRKISYNPIEIRISAFLSQKETIQLIRDNWPEIKIHQKLYGRKRLGKIKNLKLYQKIYSERKNGKRNKDIEISHNKFDQKVFGEAKFQYDEIGKLYQKAKKILE